MCYYIYLVSLWWAVLCTEGSYVLELLISLCWAVLCIVVICASNWMWLLSPVLLLLYVAVCLLLC